MTDIVRRGRLSASDEDVRGFLSSFQGDRAIFHADVDVGRAHVVMLAEQDIVSEGDAADILEALDEVEDEGFNSLPDGYEDVHPAIEDAVISRVGEDVGGQLHTARSRNDEVATCIRMKLREHLLALAAELLETRGALVELAEEHEDSLVSGYTHLQRAQPTTLAHHLLAYERAFARDTGRVFAALDRVDTCPLGSAAFAGTGFPIDRERTAELLGFSRPTRNSMDGVASRDHCVEAAAAAANAHTTLSRLSEDLVIWSTHEYGFVELDDRFSSSSSIMPQKKNPDTAELARGKAASTQAALSALLSNLKSQPMAYNRDLQEATGHVWRAMEECRSSLKVVRGAVETASFDEERMRESVERGFTGATELADTLVREAGLSFRTSHHVVAEVARRGGPVDADVVREVAASAADVEVEVSDEAVERALDPERNVEAHDSYGGPGEVEDSLEDVETELEEDREELERRRQRLEGSKEMLAQATEDIR